MIEVPPTPRALLVAWRDPVGHRCHPVARLARVPDPAGGGGTVYEFCYIRALQEAERLGFQRIVPFEDASKVYVSARLFPFFENRLMSESRPEYAGLLDRLLLPPPRADPMDVLSRTGGIRATDPYELIPIPRWDDRLPGFRTLFLVHALRHFPRTAHDRIAQLRPSEPLFILHDCQNAWDPDAVALRTEDRVLVGHIPNYLLPELYGLARSCGTVGVRVAKLNPPPAPLDQRLLCMMESCWPATHQPFAQDRFQPIPEGAANTEELVGDPRHHEKVESKL